MRVFLDGVTPTFSYVDAEGGLRLVFNASSTMPILVNHPPKLRHG